MGQTICMRQPTKKTSIGRPVNEVNCWRVAAIGPLFRHRASPSPPTEITMSAFLAALKAGPLLADGAMGSYIFERTGRLSELNHVYEALSVDDPDLIRAIHLSYLQAGARCLTTNTFAATRPHLSRYGHLDRVEELNRAAVHRAREAIDIFRQQREVRSDLFVVGSIGPTLEGNESPAEATGIYREQLRALMDEGVDAVKIETFRSLEHVASILEVAAEWENCPPLIVHMALEQHDAEGSWNCNPSDFVETVVGRGASVVGVNCCTPWAASAFIDAVASHELLQDDAIVLSAMPNAGGFQRIGNRFMTHVNSEYIGRLARTFADRGVRLIGGCCEVHPEHIREMHNFLQGQLAGDSVVVAGGVGVPATRDVSAAALEPVDAAAKRGNGAFSRKIIDGDFAVSVELLPSRGTAPRLLRNKVDFVCNLAASGLADAIDVTDGSRGIPLMPPGDFISVVRQRLGWNHENGDQLELIPHFTARDLNIMGLQSRLIGYWANGIDNVIFITGDPPKMSPAYPRSTAVFDIDSVAMIRYAHAHLNSGLDFGGQRLGKHRDPRTHFTIGTGFEPEALNSEREFGKLDRKIDAGADYVMTQPAFRFEPLGALEPYRSRIPILVGVAVLTGLEHARRMNEIPGVLIPDEIFERLARAGSAAEQAEVGVEIAAEQVRWVAANGWSGLYLMSPSSHHPVLEVLGSGLS